MKEMVPLYLSQRGAATWEMNQLCFLIGLTVRKAAGMLIAIAGDRFIFMAAVTFSAFTVMGESSGITALSRASPWSRLSAGNDGFRAGVSFLVPLRIPPAIAALMALRERVTLPMVAGGVTGVYRAERG